MNIRHLYTLIGNASFVGIIWVTDLPMSAKLLITAIWTFAVSFTYGAIELDKQKRIDQDANKEWNDKLKQLKELSKLGEDLKKELNDDKKD